MVTGHTQVYGLFGNPVAQSFSPFIHNMLAVETGQDMTYVTFKVDTGKFGLAMNGFDGLNLQGVNVTVPYKSEVMHYLDEVKGEAKIIGAVNTVVREGHRLVGYNTDWIGLKKSLDLNGVDLLGKTVLVIGAGGSARAVAVICAKSGVKKLVMTNRTASKAESIAEELAKHYELDCEVISLADLKHREDLQVAFQTTPIGMYPHIENNPVYESKVYQTLEVAVDLIYNPKETHFLREASLAGAKTVNGLGMLFYQAVAAFELWRNIKIDETIQDKCYKAFIGAMDEKMSR